MSRNRKPPAPDAAPTAASRPHHGWRILALWVLLAAAYSNSFTGVPVFDGAKILNSDPRLKAFTAENLRLIFTQEYWYKGAPSGLYRPLTTLSLSVNRTLMGGAASPVVYHATNFALHGVNTTLVYGLGAALFSSPPLGMAMAALWGLHPLLTDAVTNIAGRADLLAAFGVLAGLLCYWRGVRARRHQAWWAAGLVMAQAVGLFSKENAAVLPGLMLLADFAWPSQRPWRQRAVWYDLLAAPFVAWLALRAQVSTHMVIAFAENPLAGAGFGAARLTALQVIGRWLGLFVWPARLSADYSYNAVPVFDGSAMQWAKTFLAVIVLAAFGCLAWRARRARPALFFFAGFFLIALLPTANLVMLIGSIMAERFTYLPAVGLAGCAIVGLELLLRRVPQRVAWYGAAAVLLALAARTWARNADWRTELSFWQSTVEAEPQSARAHNNYGNALLEVPGHVPEAVDQFVAALQIRPDYADAHYNMGNALAQLPHRQADAMDQYRQALKLDPGFAQAHVNLAALLARTPGGLAEAIEQLKAAIAADPDQPAAHYNLGTLYSQIPDRAAGAAAEFRAALKLDPGSAKTHNNLASVLSTIPGREPEAIEEFRAALRLDPNYAKAHYNLANTLAAMPGRQADAAAEYREALRIQPDYAEAHNNLANLFLQMPGKLDDAVREYQAAIRTQPDLVEAHANLAGALAKMPGRKADAIAEYEAALRLSNNPEIRRRLEELKR